MAETKRCPVCKKDLSVSEFNKHSKRKDGLQSHCRECNKERAKAYYKRNKKKHREVTREYRKQKRLEAYRMVFEWFKEHPCVDCGETDPIVLEFDHVRGKKEAPVSVMIRNGRPLEAIMKEIRKCDSRCANCHRRKTTEQLDWHRLLR